MAGEPPAAEPTDIPAPGAPTAESAGPPAAVMPRREVWAEVLAVLAAAVIPSAIYRIRPVKDVLNGTWR